LAEFREHNVSLQERLSKSYEYAAQLEEELREERHNVESRDADISVKTMEIQELRNKLEDQIHLHQEYKVQVESEQRKKKMRIDFFDR
jgi:t-SNARE complex subunit (syntaxin)